MILVDLMVVICSRPKGMFKDCYIRVNAGIDRAKGATPVLSCVNVSIVLLMILKLCTEFGTLKWRCFASVHNPAEISCFPSFVQWFVGELAKLGITNKTSGMTSHELVCHARATWILSWGGEMLGCTRTTHAYWELKKSVVRVMAMAACHCYSWSRWLSGTFVSDTHKGYDCTHSSHLSFGFAGIDRTVRSNYCCGSFSSISYICFLEILFLCRNC